MPIRTTEDAPSFAVGDPSNSDAQTMSESPVSTTQDSHNAHDDTTSPPPYPDTVSDIAFEKLSDLKDSLGRLRVAAGTDFRIIYGCLDELQRDLKDTARSVQSRQENSARKIALLQEQMRDLAAQQTITLEMLHHAVFKRGSGSMSDSASLDSGHGSASFHDGSLLRGRRSVQPGPTAESGSLLNGIKTCASWTCKAAGSVVAAGLAGMAFEHDRSLVSLASLD
jgi:hypothetical protein